jgi:hypothetical protein
VPEEKSQPKAPKATATPATSSHTLFALKRHEFGDRVIERGEVLCELTVHPNVTLAQAVSMMRNGQAGPDKPKDEEAGK